MSAAQPALASPEQSSAIVRRYSNAYFTARTIVGFGTAIKVVGIILGVLVLVGGALAESQNLLVALIAAVVIGAMFFLMGIFVSAQGEILMATLDTAVNTSPFLGNDQRATIMALPEGQLASEPALATSATGAIGAVMENSTEGVVVRTVLPGSPAEKAGVRADDIIIAAEGKNVDDFQMVVSEVASRQPGSQLRLAIRRAGTISEVTVTVCDPHQLRSELASA